MFDGMLDKDLVSWNSIISGCVSNGLPLNGVELFAEMCSSGVNLDLATLVSVLPACSEMSFIKMGQTIHGYSVKVYGNKEITLVNALIDMYSKCGNLGSAKILFERMEDRSIVSWTSMISGYTRNGWFEEAMGLFEMMELEGISPDLYAITSVLHACACNGSFDQGKRMHDFVARNGLESNISVVNSLMHVYAKCGDMEAARMVFDCANKKDIISWNTMIGGFSKNCLPNEALELFIKMQCHSRPNRVTMACVLPAVASLSSLDKGREMHAQILRAEDLSDLHVSNALVDMYAKCGALSFARKIFDRIIDKDLISWTVMIAGYGMHGHGREAINAFKEMRCQGIEPDGACFISILYSCSHSGLIDEGWRFFNIMKHEYKIEPTVQHYACMVDLLSRAGRLTKAYNFITSMPIKPDSAIWESLLRACRIHRDVKLAERVAEHVFELEPENTSYYVLLANLYAEVEKWEALKKIREKISRHGKQKHRGCSWIELRNKVHVFASGSKLHPRSEKIGSFLEDVRKRMKEEGYFGQNKFILKDRNDYLKEDVLCGHSEMQAIAFGILNSSKGKPVRVTKNLTVCGDCHEVIKFMSKMVSREITLRDSERFHQFREGRCSCRGSWGAELKKNQGLYQDADSFGISLGTQGNMARRK
ncbi:uncharacterized protein A4U43_C01F17900 [Asparagus officinalis]|uniref:DYW domain-containing protein n=2 Tax=Asparagus officinalis TaxID=4686 RepID=A0A5P1FQ73_ASPOF|nr:uncharacterized protein A4U43_C01F17900 [Asparagus officinalis]